MKLINSTITPAYEPAPEDRPFDPTMHPKWERQVEWERHMLQAGAERFRGRLKQAKERGEMTRVGPYRKLLLEWIDPVAKGLWEFVESAKGKRGGQHISIPYLKKLPVETIAYITVRTVLDVMAGKGVSLLSAAHMIADLIEQEYHMSLWEKTNKDLFYETQDRLDKQKATHVHRRRVNINRFNKIMGQELEVVPWGQNDKKHLGLACIDILVRYTKRFEVIPDPSFIPKARSKKTAPYILAPTGDLTQWIGEAIETAEVSQPLYLPTLIPPKPWDNPVRGGYYTPFIRTPHMIRFKTAHEVQRHRAIDEYKALQMDNVYEALNYGQNSAWRVNKRVLAVAQEMWKRDLGVAGMPRREAAPLPPRPADMDSNPEALKKWKSAAAEVYGANARRISKVLSAKRTLDIAKMMSGEEEFYFPHLLDFRGRHYPIPVSLSPQGDDIARGLLEAANGKPVTEASEYALGIQVANSWGIDKVSYDERLQWVLDNYPMLQRIAEDPMQNNEWISSPGETPWQALAAIFDLVEYQKHGPGYVSHLPIRVDGSCNGIQHLSAMVRDPVGGASVNLLPSDAPRDIYGEVAELLTKWLKDIEGGGGEEGAMAKRWLDLCDGSLPRSLTKRPVMILPYGGTKDAYLNYTRMWLNKMDPRFEKISKEDRFMCLVWLSKKMWTVVNDYLKQPQIVMQWLKDTAKIANESGHTLYWTTPVGFVVRHFYGRTRAYKVETRIDGKRIQMEARETTTKLSERDQLKGISPNFVHSQDASAMMICLLKLKAQGISFVTTIHDSFGVLAADLPLLEDTLRDAFIENYKLDVLDDFRLSCAEVAKRPLNLPKVPPKGTLDLEEVRNSTYFFA